MDRDFLATKQSYFTSQLARLHNRDFLIPLFASNPTREATLSPSVKRPARLNTIPFVVRHSDTTTLMGLQKLLKVPTSLQHDRVLGTMNIVVASQMGKNLLRLFAPQVTAQQQQLKIDQALAYQQRQTRLRWVSDLRRRDAIAAAEEEKAEKRAAAWAWFDEEWHRGKQASDSECKEREDMSREEQLTRFTDYRRENPPPPQPIRKRQTMFTTDGKVKRLTGAPSECELMFITHDQWLSDEASRQAAHAASLPLTMQDPAAATTVITP